ncbi:MAG: GNAT family N-acetyltransferase [Magnetococcales bacterium]|nr:GNAT family N-acetyltransferase [Magnetococcales bacterium]
MDVIPAIACGGVSAAIDSEFSERSFFLKAFQGRFLTFVISRATDLTAQSVAVLQSVFSQLVIQPRRNGRDGSRILLLYEADPQVQQALSPLWASCRAELQQVILAQWDNSIPSALWQNGATSAGKPIIALAFPPTPADPFAGQVLQLGLLVRMSRLIWLDRQGGMRDEAGVLQGFFNSARLADLLRNKEVARATLLSQFQQLLAGGVKAIVLCRLSELEQELFTYTGMGSFFSRHPYCRVRRLGLDDFEQSLAIIRKGEQEGFLLPRSDRSLAQVLGGSFGAFILEDRLAGICALQTTGYQEEKMGEIVSLYTLTRFQGVGVGGQLLSHLVQEGRQLGLHHLFACTRHERVAEFFLRCRLGRHRHAFHRVEPEALPAAKWHAYDPERKRAIICVRLNLGE